MHLMLAGTQVEKKNIFFYRYLKTRLVTMIKITKTLTYATVTLAMIMMIVMIKIIIMTRIMITIICVKRE